MICETCHLRFEHIVEHYLFAHAGEEEVVMILDSPSLPVADD